MRHGLNLLNCQDSLNSKFDKDTYSVFSKSGMCDIESDFNTSLPNSRKLHMLWYKGKVSMITAKYCTNILQEMILLQQMYYLNRVYKL